MFGDKVFQLAEDGSAKFNVTLSKIMGNALALWSSSSASELPDSLFQELFFFSNLGRKLSGLGFRSSLNERSNRHLLNGVLSIILDVRYGTLV